MKLLLLLMLLTALSCQTKETSKLKHTLTTVVSPAELPFTVSVKSLKGFNVADSARFISIASKVEGLVKSDEFKAEVLAHEYKGVKRFYDTEKTNEQILTHLLSSSWYLNYRQETRKISNSVIGYTYPSVDWIVIYADQFKKLPDSNIARNIVHEQSHKLGYKHAMKWSKPRDSSVPYGLGSLIKSLYMQAYPVKK